ncbi:MAG TPA: hypothetical protein VF681_01160 [Abditibacteriaceae bacterium]|jgi:hypothetical protein
MKNSDRNTVFDRTSLALSPTVLFVAWLVLIAGIAVSLYNVVRPLAAGDASEYFAHIESWHRHRGFDLQPGDIKAVTEMAARNGYGNPDPDFGYFPSPRNGLLYGYHFWGYGLAVWPLRAALEAIGIDPFVAPGLFNFLLFALTFTVALKLSRRDSDARPLLIWTLAAGSPLLWYLRWPTPEVWTWSGIFLCLMALREQRFALAALLAALASWQNPPVLFLAFWCLLLAVHHTRTNRQPFTTLLPTVLAAGVCIVPNLFYLWYFGKPNLILATVYTFDITRITPTRLGSMLFDINQGMLPYVPLLLMLGLWSLVRAVRFRDGLALVGFAVLLVMMMACCINAHWSVGEAGMRRYSTWMLPMWAWLALRDVAWPRVRPVLLAALVWQMAMILTRDGGTFFRGHTPWAHWLLTHAPALYSPDPIIFVERSPKHGQHRYGPIPVAFVRADGSVSKLLLSKRGIAELQRDFVVDKTWLASESPRWDENARYVHPPRGAVRARPATKRLYADWTTRYNRWFNFWQ